MRAGLSDDWYPVAPGASVVLADDCGAELCCGVDGGCGDVPGDEGLTVLELRRRIRTGYDENDNPLFSWETVLSGGALVFETRTEFDAQAGVTIVVGDIKMANQGLTDIKETCIVVQVGPPEVLWAVTGQKWSPVSVDLKVRRIDA
jgi:hypothetical protein